MDKRSFIKTSAILGAGGLILPNFPVNATGVSADDATFVQNKLGYAFNALEPNIDATTMEIHYGKHHAAYTKTLNSLVKENNVQEKDIVKIFKTVSKLPAGIRNNGGGFYNHNLFWEIMGPNAGGEPSGALAKAITSDLGSFAKFKEDFSKAASTRFGSGWAWLIVKNRKLAISSTPNQDNPLMDVAEEKGTPIFAIDVWEHAYYLKYQNRRADYIGAFWNVVDWKKVEENYSKAMA
ncbi:MAG TPA: superoxide dismutase [Bacteroidales bacterium]|nr:superoxide dismutase [Bacteroidales bacterium]